MEKMKREVRKKLDYWIRMCALFTLLMSTSVIKQLRPINAGDEFTDFFSGFQLGIEIVLMLFIIKNIITYRRTLTDEEAIRDLYIKDHDERTAAIEAKSGGIALYTCGVLIIGAAVVAGYFNSIVFATLLICGVFLLLVKKGLQIYYCKKM